MNEIFKRVRALMFCSTLVLLVSGTQNSITAQVFDATISLTTYEFSRNAAMADLDRDGILDMWVLLGFDEKLGIWYGIGDGSFRKGPTYSTRNDESHFVVALIDGDSIPDALLTNRFNKELEVFLGDDTGALVRIPFQTLPSIPVGMTVLDANMDGLSDLVYSTDSTVVVMKGDGSGQFILDTTFQLSGSTAGITVGYFNSDSSPDLCVALPVNGAVAVLAGDTASRFLVLQNAPIGMSTQQVVVGDFNDDQHSDLAAIDGTRNSIVSLDGDGSGDFANRREKLLEGNPVALVAGRFGQDSDDDLAVSFDGGEGDRFVLIFNSTGDDWEQKADTMELTYGPELLFMADYNRDSVPDIIAPNRGDGLIFLFAGKQDGSFSYTRKQYFDDCPAIGFFGKFNGDEFQDFALRMSCNSTKTVVLINDKLGRFRVTSEIGHTGNGYPVVDDFTHDGIDDIILSHFPDSTVRLYESDSSGAFRLSRLIDSQLELKSSFYRGFDVNQDSYCDLVENSYYPSNGHRVRFGDRNGEFHPVQSIGAYQVGITLGYGDFNNDAFIDILFYGGSDGVHISLGSDSAPHTTSTPIHIGEPHNLAVGDINEDGNLDLVTCGWLSWTNGIRSYYATVLGNGDGTFNSPDTVEYGYQSSRIVLLDADTDGHLDLMFTEWAPGVVSLFKGKGDGSFSDPEVYYSGEGAVDMPIADINGDYSPDVIVTNQFDYSISLLMNRKSSSSCCNSRRGNVDCDPRNQVDIGDLIALVDELFIGFLGLCCEESANVDGTPGVDIGDLITLVDHLFITFQPLPSCN